MKGSEGHSSANDLLTSYGAERDVLVERIRRLVIEDVRVLAAWLWGSLGRGEADELSDVDVWIVVADEHLADLAAQRDVFIAQIGTPLVMVEAPQNAPAKGMYVLAVYAGELGPHQVDWYWQAQSAAQIPHSSHVLIERVSLPRSEAEPAFLGTAKPVERSPLDQIAHEVSFFWAMLPVVAKYVARSPAKKQIELLSLVRDPLARVREFLDPRSTSVPGSGIGDDPDPMQKVRALRAVVDQMANMMPDLAQRGIPLPSERVISETHRYLDLIAATLRGERNQSSLLEEETKWSSTRAGAAGCF